MFPFPLSSNILVYTNLSQCIGNNQLIHSVDSTFRSRFYRLDSDYELILFFYEWNWKHIALSHLEGGGTFSTRKVGIKRRTRAKSLITKL